MDLVAIKCLLVGSFKTFVEKVKRITILDISSINWDIYAVIFAFYFTLGTLLGGAAGMSIWHESSWWWGYIRGALLGAISGIISSIVVVDDIAMSFRDGENIFDVGGAEGLSEDSVAKIPKITVTSDNYVDTSGERVSCSVCLQDFEVGETVRSLPHCHHMFHIPCIDMWLIRHGSCPYCRRAL